ncbi:MAG: PLP-dependent aminotransferase family protein [Methylobacteriaceae bacterium]|jgi:2-aminoadipate transaminase|nr:PLP-dependent aminotransferase family protein [Methylobacteriaceae bacterium]
MALTLATRMSHLEASEIREILKLTARPEVISFAGGLPAPELFPIEEIKEAGRLVLEEAGASALQYTTTEGLAALRAWISERMNRRVGTHYTADQVLITSGSQQAIDLSGKVFLDEGDVVVCESPTYLAAISAFKAYACAFAEVETDDDGMVMEDLERVLKTTKNCRIIYTVPNFQNPTGRTWSTERRKRLAELAAEYQVAVLEDDPYGELRFEGDFLPSVKSFDEAGVVLSLGTFSKILCPGMRIAWIAGDAELIRQYVLVKQGTDLQCNTMAQMEIVKYLERNDIEAHIARIRETYKRRCHLMLKCLGEELPGNMATFTRPQGGLFVWVELPPDINARDLLLKCLEQNVAFVPGGAFFPNSRKENTFRMNFSNMPEERIIEGVRRLGVALRTM